MTISTTKNRINQLADGVQLIFIYDFIVLDATHMVVYVDNVIMIGGYTVNGVGNAGGGDVTFAIAPVNGTTVTLQRIVPETQLVDYLPYDPFPAETHEGALDKLTLITQQNTDALDRALIAAVTDDGSTDYTLPTSVALKGFRFNAANTGLELVDIPVIADDSNIVKKTSDTGAAIMPAGTTAERYVPPVIGMQRFNTDLGQSEEWDGTNWISSGGATGAGGDGIFYENDQVVTTDYTLTANKNAMSAGPITINTGVTVTVPTGQVWSVV